MKHLLAFLFCSFIVFSASARTNTFTTPVTPSPGSSNDVWPMSVLQWNDSTYLVYVVESNGNRRYFTWLNANRNIISTNEIYLPSTLRLNDFWFKKESITKTNDNHLLFAGTPSDTSNNNRQCLWKTDSLGNIIWQYCFSQNIGMPYAGGLWYGLYTTFELPDSSIVHFSPAKYRPSWPSPGTRHNAALISRFSKSGRLLWHHTYDDSVTYKTLALTANSELFLAGSSGSDLKILILDTLGSQVQLRTHSGGGKLSHNSVKLNNDRILVVADSFLTFNDNGDLLNTAVNSEGYGFRFLNLSTWHDFSSNLLPLGPNGFYIDKAFYTINPTHFVGTGCSATCSLAYFSDIQNKEFERIVDNNCLSIHKNNAILDQNGDVYLLLLRLDGVAMLPHEGYITKFDSTLGLTYIKPIISSLENTHFESKIEIYPNPVNNRLNYKLNSHSSQRASIKIINTNGLLIEQKELEAQEGQLDLSHLSSGMYFYEISHANQIERGKIIKE